jgi:hypothetical protein
MVNDADQYDNGYNRFDISIDESPYREKFYIDPPTPPGGQGEENVLSLHILLVYDLMKCVS